MWCDTYYYWFVFILTGSIMSASDFVSKYIPVRVTVLSIAIWMTWLVSDWAMWYAIGNTRNGVEIAAIIGAVTTPIVVFGGYVFKAFIDSRVK